MGVLVIVESPGKIKKIESILGKEYTVKASYGHIIDLASNRLSIDIDNNFEIEYVVSNGKNKVIEDLVKAYKKNKKILIATDEDREGEMIGWSIARQLELKDPDRIVFNSITKTELEKSIKNPRKIDQSLVDAQKARRVLDRLVGYLVSPIISKALGAKLSAGRVQSVVVKLLVEKEKEIINFFEKGEGSFYLVSGIFDKEHYNANLHYKNKSAIAKLGDYEQTKDIIKKSSESNFTAKEKTKKESKNKPAPPYTTSTLQQDSYQKLGYSAKRTMQVAQKLYEGGFITYMRTDSNNISGDAMKEIKKFIIDEYGETYYQGINYQSKGKTQEAHEAVRPTKFNLSIFKKLPEEQKSLFSIIWKRTIASQMKPAKYEIEEVEVYGDKLDKNYFYLITNKKLIFPGFLKVYGTPETEGKGVPNKGNIKPYSFYGKESFEKPPTRYGEATLVSKLDPKNLNIGRPSTYASIIERIITVGYVEKKDIKGDIKETTDIKWEKNNKLEDIKEEVEIGGEKNKLVPTSLGTMVTSFLEEHFTNIMQYKFTANMEDNLDKIANNELEWKNVIHEFYFDSLKPQIENVKGKVEEIKKSMNKKIGEHPDTGITIYAKQAKYGPVVYMKNQEGKIVYGPIKDPYNLENITLEKAVEILKYPKNLGKYKNKAIYLKTGTYGFYLEWDNKRISIPDDKDPENYTLEKAIKLIEENNKKYLWEKTEDNTSYRVLDGPYGRYVKIEKKNKKPVNVSLPEDINLNELTIEKINELLQNKYKKKGFKNFNKKKK